MKGLNQVNLIGNLGANPEMRYTPNGKAVATFSMATSRKYKGDNGELVEETTWHKIVCWEQLAETVNKSLAKGDPIYCQGRISNRKWQDDTGKDHSISEIIASNIIFLGKPRKNEPELPEMVGAAVAMGGKVEGVEDNGIPSFE